MCPKNTGLLFNTSCGKAEILQPAGPTSSVLRWPHLFIIFHPCVTLSHSSTERRCQLWDHINCKSEAIAKARIDGLKARRCLAVLVLVAGSAKNSLVRVFVGLVAGLKNGSYYRESLCTTLSLLVPRRLHTGLHFRSGDFHPREAVHGT